MSYRIAMKHLNKRRISNRTRQNASKSGALNMGFSSKSPEQCKQETLALIDRFTGMSRLERENYYIELKKGQAEQDKRNDEEWNKGKFSCSSLPKAWCVFLEYFTYKGEVIHRNEEQQITFAWCLEQGLI